MVLPNPNWPLVAFDCDFTAGPPGVPTANRMSLAAPQRRMAVRQFQTIRGRQYELDQTQAGTATLQVTDPLEYLSPNNGSSPFLVNGGQLIPYRTLWITAWWPPTGNMINTNVNTSFDPSFEVTTGGWAAGGTTTLAVSSAQAFVGTKSMLVTQGDATSVSWPWINIPGVPGVTVTVSIYAYLTGGASLTMTAPDGTATTTLTTQTTWTRLTLTYVQLEALDKITLQGTVSAAPTYYVDAFQTEFASTASAFTTSGPTRYSLYRGYVERFPTTYDMGGKRASRPLTAVDALAILARTVIAQNYDATIAADNPQLYLPLSDKAGPGNFTIGGQNYGKSLSPSANGQFGWGGDQHLDGTAALVMTQKNPASPPTPGTGSTQTTEWNTIQGQFTVMTAGFTMEAWVKFTSGQCTPLQVAVITDGKTVRPDQQYAETSSLFNGQLLPGVQDTVSGTPLTNFGQPVSTQGYADNLWHYLALTLNTSGTVVTVTFDNTEASGTIAGSPLSGNWGINNIHFDVYSGLGDAQSQMSIGRWAAYARDIGASTRQAHYQRGIGRLGELSGARITRLLNQYWAGAKTIATGQSALAPDFNYNTRTMLDVLQEIQETERGLLYVDANNTVVFEDRETRYHSQTATWVFGENPPGASPTEYPYRDYADDYDATYTFTQANLQRPGNTSFPPMVNAVSQTNYGQRILSQTAQVPTDFDLTQAGIFYLNRYAAPKTRITKLTLHPSANPALWPVVLSLEISQRVTVKRRSDSLTTSSDYYIEKISHFVNADTSTWTVELQLSPVWVPSAWILGDSTYGVLGTTTVPVY